MNKNRANVLRLTISAICLTLCMVLPFLTGQIPSVGTMLCPMHLPVLLCGFLCGAGYAAAVGAIAPLLRFALLGMPPLFPTGVAMCFELMTYGLVSGLAYRALPKRRASIYAALLLAMLAGRVVWGAVSAFLMAASGGALTLAAFVTAAFVQAVPGIALQIIVIPAIVLALRRALPQLEAMQ